MMRMVADAPAFAAVWPELLAFLGDAVLIGHSLGFDLAASSGMRARRHRLPPAALARYPAARPGGRSPTLPATRSNSSPPGSASTVADRHSALGDAVTTARIFVALVPRLRERGIRTLGEAMQACRALTDVLDRQHRAGWVEAAEVGGADAERTLAASTAIPIVTACAT